MIHSSALSALTASSATMAATAAEGAADIFPRIDDFVASEMRAFHVPCAALALTRNGEVVYAKGYGEARPGVAASGDTPFYLGSVSKSMTALGLMGLVEEGKVDLKAPATAYLPGFKMADPRYRSITVHDLLRQCSGLSESSGQSYLGDPSRVTIGDLVGRLASARLASEPGSRFEYSNCNYLLVGAIIEAVSGMPYARFMKDRVFEPIGLTRTSASRAESEKNGLATGSRGFFGWTLRGNVDYPEGAVPEGYISSSARDMALYLAVMQNGGMAPNGRRVLSTEGVAAMTSAQSAGKIYGYGWFIGRDDFNHGGEDAGFVSSVVSSRSGSRWGWAILLGKSDDLAERIMPSCLRRLELRLKTMLETGAQANILPSRAGLYRLVASLAAAIVLGLVLLSALSLRPWLRKRAGAFAIAIAIILHALLPLAILLLVPLLAKVPWSTGFAFAPDLSLACWILAMAEICIGAVKAVFPWRSRARVS